MATTVQPAIEFTFQEEGHIYRDTAGQPILSVTQVLDSVGIVDYPEFASVQDAMEWKSTLGTAVHKATQFIDASEEGELDWNTLDSRCVSYVVAYEKFCEEACFVAEKVELQGAVQLPQGRVAFTLDRIGKLGGLSAIVEIKCTLNIEQSVAIQTAAYEECVLALGHKPEGSPTFKRVAVQLRANGTYKCYPYHDPMDKKVWQWALALATWKQNHSYRLEAR
jgi:hypothetical protein